AFVRPAQIKMALAFSSHRTDSYSFVLFIRYLPKKKTYDTTTSTKGPRFYGRPSGASPSSQSKRGAQIFSSKGAKVAGNSSPLLSALNSPFLSSQTQFSTTKV